MATKPGWLFALIVTPLIAIIKDQVASFCSKGLLAAVYASGETQAVNPEIVRGVVYSCFQLLFFSLEMLLSRRWRKVLLYEPFQRNLIGLIVDEAHCVKSWYATISKSYIYGCPNSPPPHLSPTSPPSSIIASSQ